jgi:serine/threonine kinase PknH
MSETSQDSRAGTRFGPYLLRRLMGRGGMGEVYEAEDTVKDRIVALKLLPQALSDDPVFRKRLQREAHAAGRLQEVHVVPIHDWGEIDGQLYVDMRLIDGTDLQTILKRSGPMDPERAVGIVKQVGSALDAAHAAGVIHRDVKPANILITRDDFACLVDFGIANAVTDEKLTKLGTAIGTYAYMAPERFTTDQVTSRVDAYSLACVLHECLTGGPPYRADSVGVLISAHLYQPIPRPSELRRGIPAAFDDVLARGMAKNPQDRYATAGELAAAAHRALSAPEPDLATEVIDPSRAYDIPTLASEAGPPAQSAPPAAFTPAQSAPPAAFTPAQSAPPAAAPAQSAPPAAFTPAQSAPPAAAPAQSAPPAAARAQSQPPQFPTPPYIPVGGPPPFPATAAAPRRLGPWIIAGAVGLVVAVGAVGTWLVTHPAVLGLSATNGTTKASATTSTAAPVTPRTSTASTTMPTTTTMPTSPAGGDPQSRLLSLLPDGYSSSSCNPVNPPLPGTLATLHCEQNSKPDGPEKAVYTLYPNSAAVSSEFATEFKQLQTMVPCAPGAENGTTTWKYDETPNVPAGSIVCGTFQDRQTLLWSNTAKLFIGLVEKPTPGTLYQWWQSRNGDG